MARTAAGCADSSHGRHARRPGGWVRSDRHNRGYATRAAQALTDAAFTHLPDVDRIEIHVDRANVVSARVPEKLGYRLVRRERREKRALGHTGEGDVWQMRRGEWAPQLRT